MKRRTRSHSINTNEQEIILLLKNKFTSALDANPECEMINLSVYNRDIAVKTFNIIQDYFNKNALKLKGLKLNLNECTIQIPRSGFERFIGSDTLINNDVSANINISNNNILCLLVTENDIMNNIPTPLSEYKKEKTLLLSKRSEYETTLAKELKELITLSTDNINFIEKLLEEQLESRIHIKELTSALVEMKEKNEKLEKFKEHILQSLPDSSVAIKSLENNSAELDIETTGESQTSGEFEPISKPETTGEPQNKKRRLIDNDLVEDATKDAAEALISLSPIKSGNPKSLESNNSFVEKISNNKKRGGYALFC